MRLFLVRHSETVDNVAGLYAGVRDSALTNHGVDQAKRLGDFLAKTDTNLTHIFASPLTRAYKTAEAAQKAQAASRAKAEAFEGLDIIKVPDLIEQDFGFYEGKSFFARSDPKKTGREAHHENHKSDPGFVGVESTESMATRADRFLDQHLMPLLSRNGNKSEPIVLVVSHGILLSNLWRRLLLRLPRKSLMIAPEVTAARDALVLEHLGGWSNTGYLELTIRRDAELLEDKDSSIGRPQSKESEADTLETPVPPSLKPSAASVDLDTKPAETEDNPVKKGVSSNTLAGYSTHIIAVDSKQHLVGLKRQRGGIGRLAHDEGQKKLDDFFKKQKTS